MPTNTSDKLIELAEAAICTKGYASFSFRELAAELGIKSASVHYHFPTKAHLGLAVVKSYRQRYTEALSQIEQQFPDANSRVESLVAIYRREMLTSERMTLCTMLAAEMRQLPEEIQQELKAFYQLNLDWLQRVTGQSDRVAAQIFSLLQGALMGGKTIGDPAYFDAAVAGMTILVTSQSR